MLLNISAFLLNVLILIVWMISCQHFGLDLKQCYLLKNVLPCQKKQKRNPKNKVRRVMVRPSNRYLQLRKLGFRYMYFISLKVWVNIQSLAHGKQMNPSVEDNSRKRQKIAKCGCLRWRVKKKKVSEITSLNVLAPGGFILF